MLDESALPPLPVAQLPFLGASLLARCPHERHQLVKVHRLPHVLQRLQIRQAAAGVLHQTHRVALVAVACKGILSRNFT